LVIVMDVGVILTARLPGFGLTRTEATSIPLAAGAA